ncbi:MAG: methyltransferase family protein [Phycisphaerae bacterium]
MQENSIPTSPEQIRSRVVELIARLFCALLYVYFCRAALASFLNTQNVPVLLLLIAETMTMFLIITARFPAAVNRSLYASTITIAGSFYFVLVNVSDGMRLVPVSITVVLQLSGLMLQIIAKVHLGRSFGLVPANRGIVTSGPYRLVRHPIYVGYFLTHVGFVLSMWSLHNFCVYALLNTLQCLRIREEEKLLRQDQSYQEYADSVRYRFIPLVV